MRPIAAPALLLTVTLGASGEIHENPGSARELPYEKYIRVVSEADSPVERTYIKSKDGVYIAAAIRKPKGPGPFPALIHFHGAPGGRGMEKMVEWASGSTGGPVWERFLQEGLVVVVADYRGGAFPTGRGIQPEEITYADDGVAVLDYVRSLSYVNRDRISVYGVSLGGDVVLQLLSRTTVHRAILGAPAPINFLGAVPPKDVPPEARWKQARINTELATKNIEPIRTPILILVGTADSLLDLDRPLYNLLAQNGKQVRMEIFANGYHDFVMGPQGHQGRAEPLLDSTLDALEKSVAFVKGDAR
jgi:dipeptidyl aminopeptidase/acylaminoacyl peptidase